MLRLARPSLALYEPPLNTVLGGPATLNRVLVAVFLLALIGYGGYLGLVRHKQTEFFGNATLGFTTQKDTLGALGTPAKITHGKQFFDGLSEKHSAIDDCVIEYWYELPYAIQLHSFCFDTNAYLVHKYNWISW